MLEKVREPWRASRTKSFLAYTIFGFICLTFVFVGFNPNGDMGGSGTAAAVNDRIISMLQLQEQMKMLERQFGDESKLPAAQRQMREKMIRQTALDQLISFELVSQKAEKIGISPAAASVRDIIVNVPAFQDQGRFTRDLYDRYLTYQNTTAADFEASIKRDVVFNQLRQLFMTALATPKVLLQYEKRINETKLNVEFVKIDNAALSRLVEGGAALEKFLNDEAAKTQIKNYYDTHADEFSSQAEVHAKHILIKGNDEGALKKINEIRQEVEKGDFADLAKKYSEDEGSKLKGGDLNFFARGQMVKEFEDAAFSLPIGQVSAPVKTSYGYHIIKVEERRGGDKKPLESVRKEIAEKIMLNDVKEKKLAEIDAALKVKKDYSQWLSSLQLKWQETGEFSLNQNFLPKVDAGATAVNAAMSLKSVGETYPELIRSGADSYIFRLKSIREPNTTLSADANPGYPKGGAESLGLWAEELKKNAHIQRSQML